jgi:dienelactone hydrolase
MTNRSAHICFSTAITVCLILQSSSAAAEAVLPLDSYARADLPPLLEFLDGTPVRNLEDWADRKEEIRRLMCHYFIGTFPKSVPSIIDAEILEEHTEEDGSSRRRVKVTFSTENKVSFEMWLWIPPGKGPFPILLTAPRFYQREWARVALDRGYLVCLYPGLDTYHQEDDYPGYEKVWETFREEYPDATWTDISTKAWLASRALDYLLDPAYGYPVAEAQVGITGFSRYGKQSLIAAAFDERITSVVARSPGSPGSCAYRFTSRNTFCEAPADFPGEWFLPSLRLYTGREHELPMDAHGWMALIAPRRCMIHTAYHDDGEPTFAVERVYLEARSVYELLSCSENLRVIYRTGGHEPVTEEHRQQNLDWFDLSFHRGSAQPTDFPEELIHHFNWQHWKSQQTKDGRIASPVGPQVNVTPQVNHGRIDRQATILWALGEQPERIEWDDHYTFPTEPEPGRTTVSFGENVHGDVYYEPNLKTPAPVVIWLHPYSYPTGYKEAYGVDGVEVYQRLAREGFVVLAYDQCGFGHRLMEGRDFYAKYPKWSRLGRMVHDVHRAVDFLVDGKGQAKGPMPAINKNDIYVLGYSLGGMVALYATALDERIGGVASFSGFTPLRTDTDTKPTGGNRRLWEWHALQPRLGLFHGREHEIPYDFDDVLARIAPRTCLIVSPKRDRDTDFDDVVQCVAKGRTAWENNDGAHALTHLTPDDVNRFQTDQQTVFLEWHRK